MKLAVQLALVLTMSLAACPPAVTPTDPKPRCADVCAHWMELQCEEAEPTPGGKLCIDVCENVQSSGIVTWSLACMVKVKTCDEINECG